MQIKIYEVGPRDGLQAIKKNISLSVKKKLIEDLQNSFKHKEILKEELWPYLEIGSFVKYEKVPQMADTPYLVESIQRIEGMNYGVLVPHVKFFWDQYGAFVPAVFIAAHQEYSKKNMGAPIEVTMGWAKAVAEKAKLIGRKVRAYISNVFGYKEARDVKFDEVFKLADSLFSYDVTEISFGDTTALAEIESMKVFTRELKVRYDNKSAIHLHIEDQGKGIQLIEIAIENGIYKFDASIAGLGGAITEARALGNVSTEILAEHLQRNGIETFIDIEKINQIARWIKGELR